MNITINRTEAKLGINQINKIISEILFLRFQLTAPIKTNIINKYKMKKSLTILESKILKKK